MHLTSGREAWERETAVVAFAPDALVKRLTATGLPEALAETFARLTDDTLATKDDLSELATKPALLDAELRLEAKIEATKSELVAGMFGIIGFQTLIISGVVVAWARVIP